MRILQVATYAAIAFSFVACSGGSSAVIPNAVQTMPQADSSVRNTTQARITLHWKSPSSKSATRARGPHFVSPSAQSIQIEAVSLEHPSKTSSTIVERPKTGTASTVTFAVPAGDDAFFFAVFDKSHAAGKGIGGAQAVKMMPAGKTTPVGVTLDGYVAKATLTPGSGKAFLKTGINGETGTGFTLVGTAPVTFTVTLADADGNIILPSHSGGSISLTISQPSLLALHRTASGSNAFAIQAIQPNPAFTPITIDLQVTSGSSGSQLFTQQYGIREEALLYAASTGSPGSVTLFDQEGNTYPAPGGFPGLENPAAIAWDADDATLFIADTGRQEILAYDGSGNALKGWTAPRVPGMTSIAYNHDTRRVYVTTAESAGASQDAIAAFDLHGHAVRIHGFAGLTGPISIAYTNTATMNNPQESDRFWVITTLPSGVDTLRSYATDGSTAAFSLNGNQVTSEVLTGNGFVPAAVSAQFPSWVTYASGEVGGTGSNGCTIVGTYNGQGALAIAQTPVTGIGLKNPHIAVQDPLFDFDAGLGIANQPVEFYVANGAGGLVAVGYNSLNHFQQIKSVSFSPPTGATSFSALDVTF